MEYTWHYDSPLGGMTLASDGEALTGLWFDGQQYFGNPLDTEHEAKMLPVFQDTCRWLDIYFSGEVPGFTPKLHLRTTAFRKRVWEILLAIPYGRTMTYGEIASRIAREYDVPHISARAVGGAVGHNSILIIIPCHRVSGKYGSLTGYAGGLDKKGELLQIEKTVCSLRPIPKRGT
ncbi:MAG: methylated-DNA--[protein]-cysteine S-methyltransferase [Bacteroidales bacterium]|nr:methylated-DNA--[protein]-cysteine S-methyltransferase [Bacteroidales bacterium]